MNHCLCLMLLVTTAGCSACSGPALEELAACRYAELPGTESRFVRPSFEAYVSEAQDPPFYLAPDRKRPLRLTTFSYDRDFVGRHYRPLDIVDGRDGRYQRWLLEDCRLLYSPLPAVATPPPSP